MSQEEEIKVSLVVGGKKVLELKGDRDECLKALARKMRELGLKVLDLRKE